MATCINCNVSVEPWPGFCPVCCPPYEQRLREARASLALQAFRYADKHGIPDAVHFALRDTLAPDGYSPLPPQRPIVEALAPFLRFDGGDFGLRRAFDAFVALLDEVEPERAVNPAPDAGKEPNE